MGETQETVMWRQWRLPTESSEGTAPLTPCFWTSGLWTGRESVSSDISMEGEQQLAWCT